MNCNTTHYRANSSSVPGDPTKYGRDNELWLQRSTGTFEDVGTAQGLGDLCGRSHYVEFLSANGDAWPDLYVGNGPPRNVSGDPCDDPANGLPDERSKLYLGSRSGAFTLNRALGIAGNGGARCAEAVRLNGDARDDLLVCGNPRAQLYLSSTSGYVEAAAANNLSTSIADGVFGDLDRDGDADLVSAVSGAFRYQLNNGGRLGAPVRIGAVPSGGSGRAVALGDADGDGDLDVYGLVSNLSAGTNPPDTVYLNQGLRFTAVPVPGAGGAGDAVATLDGDRDGRAEFLVLNGAEAGGNTQRIELVLR